MRPLRILLVCLFAVPFLGRSAETSTKPNVLFIAVDDLKPLLGCYGDRTVKSPNIDRLAARGMVFQRAYCNQAVCSPSRNALLTGLRPTTVGIYDLSTNFRKATPDAVTMPQWFKQHGYRTEAMGKLFHVGHGNHEDAASWSVPHFRPKGGAEYVLTENKSSQEQEDARLTKKNPANRPRGAAYESADVPDDTYADGKIADEAIRRLREAKGKAGEPFFMAVGFLKPHLPFCAPKKYWDLYNRESFKLAELHTSPEGAPSYAPTNGGELRQYMGIPKDGPLPDDLQRTLIHGYHAAVSYMDAQLGRILDELDRLGLSEKTLVVFWGDHGWHLGDHGMWCKHTNYEEASRIPLIVAVPGVTQAGGQRPSLVESVDIYPTLCELAGLPVPEQPEGKSFVATLKDPAVATKEAIFHVYPRGSKRLGRAVRTARYRLVEWKQPGAPAESAELELYDYETDPMETKNLASEQPAVVSQLRAIIASQPEAKPQIRVDEEGKKKADAKPKQDRATMFTKRDRDNDGKLTREEFLANQPDPEEAPKRFPRFDANGDGVLSKEEFVSMGKAKP